MRLTTVFLIASLLQVSAAGLAQQVTLKRQNAKLTSIFDEIRQQTGYDFVYNDKMIDQAKPVTIQVTAMALNEVLNKIFENQPLNFDIQEKTIVVKEKLPSFLDKTRTVLDLFQRHDASGRVVNDNGDPLAGASVTVKGTNRSTKTNERGIFFLSGLKENDVLVISFIGFESLEIGVKAAEKGDIKLKEIVGQLDEVRLIGYGTTTQRLATGNTSRITAADIEKQPVANPLQTLQGRMPGVLVTNGQGLPGTETKIQIRGINSIAGNRDPLYVINGVPFSATSLYDPKTSGVLAAFNNAASGRSFTPFNSISPSDIESIDVLKDADATAIYGARGANGVILITTKKGKAGVAKFDFNINYGVEEISRLFKNFLNTPDYLKLEREGAKNDDFQIEQNKLDFPELFEWDQNKTTNWFKVILANTARLTNVIGNVSGGNEEITFLLGGNYHKEGTIYPGDQGYVRGGAHVDLDHKSKNGKFFMSTNVNYSSDKNALISFMLSPSNMPNYPLYLPNGMLNFDGGPNYLAGLKARSTSKTDNLIASTQFVYYIMPNLIFKTGLGFNKISLNGFSINPIEAQDPSFNPINFAQYSNNASKVFNVEPQLVYSKSIFDGELRALIGGTYQSRISQGDFIQGENYKDENLFESLGAAGNINNSYFNGPQTTYSQSKYISFLSNVNYIFKGKYILNGNFRRDGSSRFGPDKQYGNFGSVGVAWLFSNESVIKSALPLLSYGKLRSSYGMVGNEPGVDYAYLQTFRSFGSYQGNSVVIPARIANPDYKWEVNDKLEVAMDLGFLSDNILFSMSWFKNRTKDQLIFYKIPAQTGFSAYLKNFPAIIDNKGLEFSLSTKNINSVNLHWSTNFNLSFIDNKLVSFPGLESSFYKRTYEIGRSISILKGYLFAGVDPQNGDPLFYNSLREKTNSPQYPNDSNFNIGKTMPVFYGGLGNTVRYKNIQLDFLFQFTKQGGYRPPFYPGYNRGYMPKEALMRWQNPGDITNVPKASLQDNRNRSYEQSDYFFDNASYVKLKNVALNYSLPNLWINKTGISQFKIYVQGQNLLTFTNYKGVDPEIPSPGIIVPTLRVVTAGLQITL